MTDSFSALDAFRPALHHTRNQLFRPFRLGLWARLALIGMATGDMPGCGGGGGGGGGGGSTGRGGRADQFLDLPTDPLTLSVLIFLGVLLVVSLLLVLGYISGVSRFILFDTVVTDRYHLLPGWRRFRERGLNLFLWQLVFAVALLASLAIAVGIPALLALAAGAFKSRGPGLALALVLGLWAGAGALLVLTAAFLVWILTRDFVVPIMALEDVGVLEGWRRFIPLCAAQKVNYVVYLILRTLLVVAALIVFGILALLLSIILLLLLGAAGLTLFLGGMWAEWTWNPYTIALAVGLGGAALLVLLYAIALVCTPAVAFFPTYAAHFLSFQYPRLSELLNRHPSLHEPAPGGMENGKWKMEPPPPPGSPV